MPKRSHGRRPKPNRHRVRLPAGYARPRPVCDCPPPDCSPPDIVEFGSGPYAFVRMAWDLGAAFCFRFETQAETLAAQRVSMALDHVLGAPPELVDAILEAAREAREAA